MTGSAFAQFHHGFLAAFRREEDRLLVTALTGYMWPTRIAEIGGERFDPHEIEPLTIGKTPCIKCSVFYKRVVRTPTFLTEELCRVMETIARQRGVAFHAHMFRASLGLYKPGLLTVKAWGYSPKPDGTMRNLRHLTIAHGKEIFTKEMGGT